MIGEKVKDIRGGVMVKRLMDNALHCTVRSSIKLMVDGAHLSMLQCLRDSVQSPNKSRSVVKRMVPFDHVHVR